MRVLDLCSGSGSATKAFSDRGHTVDTVDIVGQPTYLQDVRTFVPEQEYFFVWASPPCTEFSLANYRLGRCADRHPDMSIVEACMRICRTAPFWILENPKGCLRHFIGLPEISIRYGDFGYAYSKPTDLWGMFPFQSLYRPYHVPKVLFSSDSLGKKNRACVPYELSMAICSAMEGMEDAFLL